MIRCKWCKKSIVETDDNDWIHEEDNQSDCGIGDKKASPEKFCISCKEPQYDSEICGCGYKYEIREI